MSPERFGRAASLSTAKRQTFATHISLPPERRRASINSIRLPGRSTFVSMLRSTFGIGLKISRLRRPIRIASFGWRSSTTRAIRASGGPACWACRSQGLVVASVASNVPRAPR